MTKILRTLIAVAAFAAAVVTLTAAGQTREQKLQQAIDLIESKGDLAKAMPLLEDVAKSPDRALAARALLYLAQAQERQGQAQARQTYERIVKEFAAQRDVAAEAGRRLAAMGAAPSPALAGDSSQAPRRVLDGEWTLLFDISPDGRLAVGQRQVRIGTQEIVVRDLSTGATRVLDVGGGGVELSDDRTRVAFSPRGQRGLKIVGTGAGTPPVVIAAPAGASLRPADWAPDGRSVLVEITHDVNADSARSGTVEYAWVSVADQSFRSIRTFEGWAAPRSHDTEPAVSPDGRFIAFVARPDQQTQDRFLYVMDVDGRRVEPVISTAGQRAWPTWTRDGRHLLFTEERSSSGAGLWSVAVENGRAAGSPQLLHRDIGSGSALLGVTTAGVLHYRRNAGLGLGSTRYGGNASHVVARNLANQRPTTFRGCCGAWSPDGRWLAFLGDGDGVVIRQVETGEERSYELPGASVSGNPFWLHDGSAVIVVGVNEAYSGSAENRENLNYYRIDLGSGAVRPVMNVGPLASWRAAVSKDDRTLYVAKRDQPKGPFTQIVALDMAAGTQKLVAPLPAGILLDPEIVVSPDGTTLAVGAVDGRVYQSDGRIFTVKVDGTDFRDVGGGGIRGFWGGEPLRWKPDGRSLLFRGFDAQGDWRIMRVPASGGPAEFDGVSYTNLAPLVPDIRMVPGNFNGFDVSPDGSRLVVSTLTSDKFEVWALARRSWAR